MTKVTIDETTYSVTVAEENVNVTVADATETIQVQIASGASDIQIITSGDGNSLIAATAGVVTTMKSISSGDNITLSDDGNTITISATEDDLSNNTTDDLTEGTNNLYFTEDRVDTALSSVTGHIIPSASDTYDLGSPTNVWRDLYLGPNSLYVDGQQIVSSDEGTIDITTDAGQNLRIGAGGTLDLDSGNNITRLLDNAVTIGSDNAILTVNGIVRADNLELDDLDIQATLINQTLANGNLEIRTNGTGYLHANVTDLYVGPLAGAVKIDENSISTTDATQLTIEGFTNSADMTTAINTAETNANDYTDTREVAITTAYQAYADQSEADAITASNSYADTAISNLVDSAPATLDTLNELAAALGDDANFSTTVTNSIATKWTQDNTKISNWDTAYGWGDHSIVGYLTDYTVTESDVTQHQAALSITESQISDLTHYTDSDARTAVSLTSTNVAELSYDSATGVFSYVSPTTVTASNAVTLAVRNASGVDIAKGDAVYLAGHSGNKILVAKADNDASGQHPAIGLASGAMLNNSDGLVTVYGELAGVNTSSYAVGDVLYLSATAGALTNVRPTGTANSVQNIGKVARSDNNGIIVVSGSGRENDVPNLAHQEVFIGNLSGYEKRQLDTDDVLEAANLYYTDARVQNWFATVGLGMLSTSVVPEGSNLYFTDARAISAVENESTLDLSGTVKVTGSASTKNTIIGDETVGGVYDQHGFTVNAGDTAWAGINLVETTGSTGKPIPNFSNPSFGTTIFGGTESSKTGVESGKRIWTAFALASQDGSTPNSANFRILAETTEQQSSSARGSKMKIETTANGSTSSAVSLEMQDNVVTINPNGNGTLTTGGNLNIDTNVTVNGTISADNIVEPLNPFLLGGM